MVRGPSTAPFSLQIIWVGGTGEVGSVRRDQEMFQRVQSRFDLTLIRDFFYSLTLKKNFCIIYT